MKYIKSFESLNSDKDIKDIILNLRGISKEMKEEAIKILMSKDI
jgi:hypothetical protein